MQAFFLTIPWMIFLGIAAQTTLLYICTSYLLATHPNKNSPAWRHIGFCFITMWAIFPILSSFNAIMEPTETTWLHLTKSHFPSSLLALGVLFCMIPQLPIHLKTPNWPTSTALLKSSSLALLCVTVVSLYQHYSGWDYRLPQGLDAQNLMAEGRYRIRLFHGHPLTFASVVLAWLSVLTFMPVEQKKDKHLQSFNIFCCILLLFMTGARTAIAVGVLLLGWRLLQQQRKIALLSIVVLFICAGMSGLFQRFTHISLDSPRFRLWRVHWNIFTDRPWSGVGYHAIHEVRPHYYETLFTYDKTYMHYNAHQFYLEILAEIGFLGFSVLTICCWFISQSLKELIPQKSQRMIFYSVFGVNLIHGFTQNTYFDASVMAATLACFILTLSMRQEKEPMT